MSAARIKAGSGSNEDEVDVQRALRNWIALELFDHRVALAPGGVIEIVDQSTIPDVNRKLFIDVVQMFGARVLGIDVIFEKGIEVPVKCLDGKLYVRLSCHVYNSIGDFEALAAALGPQTPSVIV